MITNLNELFLNIENRIGRKLTQAERLAIRGQVVTGMIPKENRMEDAARAVADRIIENE